MPTALEITDTNDAPIASLSFSAVPGSATAWQTIRLWNDRDGAAGADTARGLTLGVLARPAGASTPFVATGLSLLDLRGIEVRFAGVLASLGSGSTASLPEIEPEAYLAIEIRVRPSAGASVAALEVAFTLDDSPWSDLGDAVPSPGGVEIREDATWLASGGEATETGPTSGSVAIAYGAALVDGAPIAWGDIELELGEDDGSAHTLVSGEAYVALVLVDLTGPYLVRGDAVTAPPAASDDPAVAADAVVLARVVKRYLADIETTDIADRRQPGGLGCSDSGLTVTVGAPGSAIVGRRRVRISHPQTVTMPPSSARILSLLPDGTLELAATAAPANGERLAEIVSGASSVTTLSDARRFVGWSCSTASLASAAGSIALVPLPGAGAHLRIIDPIEIRLGGETADLGNTAAAWEFDVEEIAADGSFVSVLAAPSSIAFDAVSPVVARPALDRLLVARLLRITLTATPTGGSLAPLAVSVWWRPAPIESLG